MINFFLHNQALGVSDFELFKSGVQELMQIKRKQDHIFFRNESCFENIFFIQNVFPDLNKNRELLPIYDFFMKLSPCEIEVQNEESANEFSKSEQNGFIGIDFTKINISNHKKIANQIDYESWIAYYQSKFERLESLLSKIKSTAKFRKTFNDFDIQVQDSIINKFDEAIKRNVIQFPDENIVKNVSNSNKCVVLELRVYSPIALRVYFNFTNNIFNLASIGQKSNPDQNEDIKNAEKLLIHLNS